MIFFLALHVVLCLALFDPLLHTGGDGAAYLLLAESVQSPSDGYSTTIDPGPPTPHAKYPPGYPALLALFQLVFGGSVIAAKALSMILTGLSVLGFCHLTRGRFRRGVWLALCGAFAVNPIVVEYSHWILSEAAFLAVVLAALVALDRDRRAGPTLGKWFWLGLAGGVACFYVRQIGALFLVGTTMAYARRRDWRKLLVHGSVGAALAAPWLIRSRLVSGEATPYYQEFLLKSVYQPELGYVDFGDFLARIFNNVETYLFRELPRVVSAPAPWREGWAIEALCVAIAVLILVGLFRSLRRFGPMECFFVLTLAATLAFEEVVSDVRYLVPLVPAALIYATRAMVDVPRDLSWIRRWTKRAFPVAALLSVGALGLVSQTGAMPGNLDKLSRASAGGEYAGYHPSWRHFFEASEWVRTNTPEDAVFTVRKPRLFRYLSGRRAVIFPFTYDADSVWAQVETTDYVLFAPVSGITSDYLARALDANQDRWSLVHSTEEPFAAHVLKVSEQPYPEGR